MFETLFFGLGAVEGGGGGGGGGVAGKKRCFEIRGCQERAKKQVYEVRLTTSLVLGPQRVSWSRVPEKDLQHK